ncbi:dentin matrix acidic phosphoprotein 1-like [Etheostoma spectabile]|uniref:dentin matrix acidic phosphoprotein 1-like n=1 Tax=Etheostoma spectabile TaxID=54343 RepID=UPI0013AF0425|nr:dentin matrix acidic phosphoprotein 1-like [Etheostoma spectabile]
MQDRTYERNVHSTLRPGTKSASKARRSQLSSSRSSYEERDSEAVEVKKRAQSHGSQINHTTRYKDHVLYEATEVSSNEEESDEVDEHEIPGEDLDATMLSDEMESSDKYDSNDEFIDNGPIKKDCSNEESIKPAVKRSRRAKESRVKERRVKKELIGTEKNPFLPNPTPEEDTRNRQWDSMRCKTVKPNNNTQAPLKQDSPGYNCRLSDSDSYVCEVPRGGANADIKGPPVPVDHARQGKRRSHSKTQKREITEHGKQQESLSNYPEATTSRWTPGAAQTQGPKFPGEAAVFANFTKQAAWASDSLESDQEDQKDRDPVEEHFGSEDHSNQLNGSASEDENHPEHEDSDLGLDSVNAKLDRPKIDYDNNNCATLNILYLQ